MTFALGRALAALADAGAAGRTADDDALTFRLTDPAGGGLETSLDGTALTVTAANDVPKGTTTRATFTVSDGEADPVPAQVEITVTSSTRPLATVNPDRVENVHQGEPVVIPVLENDASPFPGEPLVLLSAQLDTGQGTVEVVGDDVVVTPAETFVGTLTARYTVADATQDEDRNVEGRIEVTVLGRPGEILAPLVEEVRSRTVVLSWSPPVNNGSVITHYVVTASDGRTFECETTTCTLEGLTNNVEYTFSVVAHNDVRAPDPSPASAPAPPDRRPDPAAAPTRGRSTPTVRRSST